MLSGLARRAQQLQIIAAFPLVVVVSVILPVISNSARGSHGAATRDACRYPHQTSVFLQCE